MRATKTVRAERHCVTCGEPVRYRGERECQRISDTGWIHVATGERRAPGSDGQHTQFDFHWAEPVPQCPECGSFAYSTEQTMYGIQSRCPDCRYQHYFSLGD